MSQQEDFRLSQNSPKEDCTQDARDMQELSEKVEKKLEGGKVNDSSFDMVFSNLPRRCIFVRTHEEKEKVEEDEEKEKVEEEAEGYDYLLSDPNFSNFSKAFNIVTDEHMKQAFRQKDPLAYFEDEEKEKVEEGDEEKEKVEGDERSAYDYLVSDPSLAKKFHIVRSEHLTQAFRQKDPLAFFAEVAKFRLDTPTDSDDDDSDDDDENDDNDDDDTEKCYCKLCSISPEYEREKKTRYREYEKRQNSRLERLLENEKRQNSRVRTANPIAEPESPPPPPMKNCRPDCYKCFANDPLKN